MRVMVGACALLLLLAACARRAMAPLAPLTPLTPAAFPFAVDSVRTEALVPGAGSGAVHRTIWSPAGPWVIHLLDVRLDQCFRAVAVKGAPGAIGRRTTSDLMRDLAASGEVIGGVNADFFLFTPPGVPTNVHVSAGRVITPPVAKPAFAIDSAGVPRLATFTLPGLDSLTVDDARLARASLRPFHPLEAVGGRPVLTRDSVIVPEVDTEGQASFSQARHPRTAVGIAERGRRLILLVVDGRQPDYSAGMTLRELATLMLALGAPESLNLDGGGSTALVLARTDSARAFRAVNRPSDPTGERAVGNALAIVKGCSQ
jgi:Phosphodiester glycosidase